MEIRHGPRIRSRARAQEGTARLLAGELEEAIGLFTLSLEAEPTAEAYTFRGWAYSFAGRLDEAIEECRKAIATDPSFGNPYNDIGCYLMEKGDWDDAIPWFERAKTAPRYDPRHFPYLNLGRIHARARWRRRFWSSRGRSRESGDPQALSPPS
jgi:Tfp pilus assembly protein PilF